MVLNQMLHGKPYFYILEKGVSGLSRSILVDCRLFGMNIFTQQAADLMLA